jgi:hypothetical protein
MRAEAIVKKISCTVVKTSLLHGTGDFSISRPQDESWQSKPFATIAQINSPKRAVSIAEVLSEFAPSSRFLDYYA